MKFSVKAETHEGNVMTLRGGFLTADEAEGHPVKLSFWKRVWIEPIKSEPERPAVLPPLPWDWVLSGTASANGQFNAYLVDATGRKIGAIWGKGAEKKLIADHILNAVNATTEKGDSDEPPSP